MTNRFDLQNLVNRFHANIEFYKDMTEKSNIRYMRLRLIEKYDKARFPLKELREHGLTNVQGRSKVTIQLLNFLQVEGI